MKICLWNGPRIGMDCWWNLSKLNHGGAVLNVLAFSNENNAVWYQILKALRPASGWLYGALKTESRHGGNFVIARVTIGCHNQMITSIATNIDKVVIMTATIVFSVSKLQASQGCFLCRACFRKLTFGGFYIQRSAKSALYWGNLWSHLN